MEHIYPIKVLRIIARLNIGGPAIHTVLLTAGLHGRFESRLVTGAIEGDEGDMSYFAARHGVLPETVPEMRRSINLFRDCIALIKLIAIIHRERPMIVHTHTAKAGTLGRCAALLCGVPITVHSFHGHVFDGYFSPLKTWVFLWIERFLALFTSKIVTVSESVKEELIDTFKIASRKKVSVIPLGFDLDPFLKNLPERGSLRDEYGLHDALVVGIVGRLVPIKDHSTFLRAAAIILRQQSQGALSIAQGKKVKFVVVGDGQTREELAALTKDLRIETDVIFTGWQRDVAKVYADCDIVALTSLNEGTPVSLIEAMASSRCVVATDVGGVNDVVEHEVTGLIVSPEDPQVFADALKIVLEDDAKRISFGAQGKERVARYYAKERLFSDIERLYDELIKIKNTD